MTQRGGGGGGGGDCQSYLFQTPPSLSLFLLLWPRSLACCQCYFGYSDLGLAEECTAA